MPEIRCFEMDGVAQKLSEAIRQREGLVSGNHRAIDLTYVCLDIAQLHHRISDHRKDCPICREVDAAMPA